MVLRVRQTNDGVTIAEWGKAEAKPVLVPHNKKRNLFAALGLDKEQVKRLEEGKILVVVADPEKVKLPEYGFTL